MSRAVGEFALGGPDLLQNRDASRYLFSVWGGGVLAGRERD
jgi:hypothetical protein